MGQPPKLDQFFTHFRPNFISPRLKTVSGDSSLYTMSRTTCYTNASQKWAAARTGVGHCGPKYDHPFSPNLDEIVLAEKKLGV